VQEKLRVMALEALEQGIVQARIHPVEKTKGNRDLSRLSLFAPAV